MHANGNIEGVTLRHSAGLAWRPRGRDPTPGDWNSEHVLLIMEPLTPHTKTLQVRRLNM